MYSVFHALLLISSGGSSLNKLNQHLHVLLSQGPILEKKNHLERELNTSTGTPLSGIQIQQVWKKAENFYF